jgi:hypothetical protein
MQVRHQADGDIGGKRRSTDQQGVLSLSGVQEKLWF